MDGIIIGSAIILAGFVGFCIGLTVPTVWAWWTDALREQS